MAIFSKPPLPHELPGVPDDAEMVTLEMTAERKKRIESACEKVVDILYRETKSPLEGVIVLQWIFDAMKATYGPYYGSVTLGPGEPRPGSVSAVKSQIGNPDAPKKKRTQ